MQKVAQSIPQSSKLLTDYKALQIALEWLQWLRLVAINVDRAPKAYPFNYDTTGASLPSTDLQEAAPALPNAGLYRVTYLLRIVDAGAGDVIFTVSWAVAGVASSVSGSPLAGAVSGSVQSGSVLVQLDGTAVISIAAAVALGSTFTYKLDVVLEEVQ